jgi:tetrahydromethanopterin S-methyltransferase subunit A
MVYDCLGCEVCYPALALNALGELDESLASLEACPGEVPEGRAGWPPLPGDYTVLRYHAPVAVCTLTDPDLARAVARQAGTEVALVGTLHTENLGIERLIFNLVGNPNVRFLVVCGPDSRQAVGHLPGRSLLALARWGLDDHRRILHAPGKRPVLRNLDPALVDHFRRSVEVVDLVGESAVPEVLQAISRCAAGNPGPCQPWVGELGVPRFRGFLPDRVIPDPAGYFVVYPDRSRGLLSLEHYRNDGLLDAILEGSTAAELYTGAIERRLVSRLDHAAYLGRELARAERALVLGEPYLQDAAPERPRCGCGRICPGDEP